MNCSNPIQPRNVAGPIIDDEIMANERSGEEVENRNKNEFDFLRNMRSHSSLSSTHLFTLRYMLIENDKLWLFFHRNGKVGRVWT